MYTYSDFTVLIALNYMNKVQTEKKKQQQQQENREKRQDKVLSNFVCNNCSRDSWVRIGFWGHTWHCIKTKLSIFHHLVRKKDGCYPNKIPIHLIKYLQRTSRSVVCLLWPALLKATQEKVPFCCQVTLSIVR